jgi:hypothetical protein
VAEVPPCHGNHAEHPLSVGRVCRCRVGAQRRTVQPPADPKSTAPRHAVPPRRGRHSPHPKPGTLVRRLSLMSLAVIASCVVVARQSGEYARSGEQRTPSRAGEPGAAATRDASTARATPEVDTACGPFRMLGAPLHLVVPGVTTSTVHVTDCDDRRLPTVRVTLKHDAPKTIAFELVGPSGRAYPLRRAFPGEPWTSMTMVPSAEAAGEAASGVWVLRTVHTARSEGVLLSWFLTF